jgi:hypothetical protein
VNGQPLLAMSAAIVVGQHRVDALRFVADGIALPDDELPSHTAIHNLFARTAHDAMPSRAGPDPASH